MILSKSSWYSKVYFFIQSWWAYSKCNEWEGRKYEDMDATSDICTFMRAFIIKLPILIFAHLFMYWMIFFTLIQFPLHYLGLTGYFTTILVILGIIGLGVGAYFGQRQLRNYLNMRPVKVKQQRTEPTFFELFCAWIKARHDKVCVLMTFEDTDIGSKDV